MATIHRDGDLELLDGKVAVIGFGSQGHAHALNLRDSGVEVVVGLRDGSSSRAAAEEAGLEVAPIADAVRGAQVVAMLVPDHVQKGVWDSDVAPNLEPGAAVLFAHGLNIHFGRIVPPEDHDVIMVAPKAPGHRVRELFVSGAGTPGLVAIQQDASGRALPLALAYGVGAIVNILWPRSPNDPWYSNYSMLVTTVVIVVLGAIYMVAAKPYERGNAPAGDAHRLAAAPVAQSPVAQS